ncbi:hypothetical protein VB10N_15790 [Vibrio sp. 10N]|nr:hypothetical protein VB10N_15790 [Vibrio sp. 10N]
MCQSLVVNFGAKSSIIKALSATLSQICHYKVSFLDVKSADNGVFLKYSDLCFINRSDNFLQNDGCVESIG